MMKLANNLATDASIIINLDIITVPNCVDMMKNRITVCNNGQ